MSTRRRLHLASLAAIGLLAPTRFARADVISLHPSQDVTLYGSLPPSAPNADPTSSGPGMFVGSDNGPNPRRGIVQFNLSAIPAGSLITSATLTLYVGMVAGSDSTPRTISLFDVTTPWSPSSVGTTGVTGPGFGGGGQGSAHPAGDHGASWNYAVYTSTPWTTPGGDFSSTVSASLSVSQSISDATHTNPYAWASTAQTIADVQGWLDNPLSNDGWLLKNASEATKQTFRRFYTQEGAIEQNVPQLEPTLTVTFTPIPEPASLTLVALAAPAILARRRNRKTP